MNEVIANDRRAQKVRVKCDLADTFTDLEEICPVPQGRASLPSDRTPRLTFPPPFKGWSDRWKVNAADWWKIVLKKWYTSCNDHITPSDYEIHSGMSLDLYYVHSDLLAYTFIQLTFRRVEKAEQDGCEKCVCRAWNTRGLFGAKFEGGMYRYRGSRSCY